MIANTCRDKIIAKIDIQLKTATTENRKKLNAFKNFVNSVFNENNLDFYSVKAKLLNYLKKEDFWNSFVLACKKLLNKVPKKIVINPIGLGLIRVIKGGPLKLFKIIIST